MNNSPMHLRLLQRDGFAKTLPIGMLFTGIMLITGLPAVAMDSDFASSPIGHSAGTNKASYSSESEVESVRRTKDSFVDTGRELYRAAGKRNIDRVQSLIEQRAEVNWADNRGDTAVNVCVYNSDPDLLKILIRAGATVNHLSIYQHSPLVTAADIVGRAQGKLRQKRIDCIEALITAGADVGHENAFEETALKKAAEYNLLDVASRLLQALTSLTSTEKDSVKTFLFANKKREKMGQLFFRKDMRILVARNLIPALAQRLHARIMQAGAPESLEIAHSKNFPDIMKLLHQYLAHDFLIKRVQEQITRIKPMHANTQAIAWDEACGTFESKEEQDEN